MGNRPHSLQDPDLIWHTLTVDETFACLETRRQGLTEQEAQARLNLVGPNELESPRSFSLLALFLGQFANVLILILLVGAGISIYLGHLVESITIVVIVLFSSVLGFIQEYRAERALEKLKQIAAPAATVIRAGLEENLPARQVVPGDILVLRTGDKIPADARLFEVANLRTDESPLTGESTPIDKHCAPLEERHLPVADRHNMVFAGTTVTYGRGRAVVTTTGNNMEFGQVAKLLASVETTATPLKKNLNRAGVVLARLSIFVVLMVVMLGLWRGEPVLDMLLFGIALAVAVVPEALPVVVTVSLALGVQRMARRNALIRQLPAVETLGSVTFICSDKTGTLTRNEMTVRQLYAADALWEVEGAGYVPRGRLLRAGKPVEPNAVVSELLKGAALCNDAVLLPPSHGRGWRIQGDTTEAALLVAAVKAGLSPLQLAKSAPRVGEIPFTSEAKRMTTLHAVEDGLVAYAKGAPEVILTSCTEWLSENGVQPLGQEERDRARDVAHQMAERALRVLAVATKRGTTQTEAEHDMVFLGFAGMIDPPRDEARAAIKLCAAAGIKPVMITGDHMATAQAVARELGLWTTGRAVSGPELEEMSDADLLQEVERIEVYARVSPIHKLRVVDALQKRGHIVAMTGDGINDAPALKKADIGIAMGLTGTDVSKEAAAMTLTDDNFASIVAAVEEGRAIFANVKKYLVYLLSSNIGEIGLIGTATALGLPLPLSPVQILYVNLATDGLPALALAVDPKEADLMRRGPRNPHQGVFNERMVTLMLAGGFWSTAVTLGLYLYLLGMDRAPSEARTMIFVCLVLIEFLKAYVFRSERRPILVRLFGNRWLNLAVLWEILLLGCIVYWPVLQAPFGTVPLDRYDLALVGAAALTIVPVLELFKWVGRNRP